MDLIFQFSQDWYVLFFSFFLAWLGLFIYRKSYKNKKEMKEQTIYVSICLTIAVIMEFFAVSTDLWHYMSGDWPVILWFIYSAILSFGYQLMKLIGTNKSLKNSL